MAVNFQVFHCSLIWDLSVIFRMQIASGDGFRAIKWKSENESVFKHRIFRSQKTHTDFLKHIWSRSVWAGWLRQQEMSLSFTQSHRFSRIHLAIIRPQLASTLLNAKYVYRGRSNASWMLFRRNSAFVPFIVQSSVYLLRNIKLLTLSHSLSISSIGAMSYGHCCPSNRPNNVRVFIVYSRLVQGYLWQQIQSKTAHSSCRCRVSQTTTVIVMCVISRLSTA